jgi:hypothetical protein
MLKSLAFRDILPGNLKNRLVVMPVHSRGAGQQ